MNQELAIKIEANFFYFKIKCFSFNLNRSNFEPTRFDIFPVLIL